MKLPLSWIREFVDIELDPLPLAHLLTMSGTEVESMFAVGESWRELYIGEIRELTPHPADQSLRVARIDLGSRLSSIVTAVQDLSVGDRVPIALPGGSLGNGHGVSTRDFAGVRSEGMLLSPEELGLGPEKDRVCVLEPEAPIGQALNTYLKEVVFDFNITPNRPDEMSVVGIAREIAALTNRKLKRRLETGHSQQATGRSLPPNVVSVAIHDPDLCLRYSALPVEGLRIGPSPPWMQRRLYLSGLRPISNVVDITNYVLLEKGQPLHAFDADRLSGGIVVRRARAGERLQTIDAVERELTTDMLVIADHQRPQAVAGVMGGLDSEVGPSTRRVVIESANFEPTSIRRTSRYLRLSTEASRRFERALDPECTLIAAERAASLMVELCGGAVSGTAVDLYPTALAARRIFTSPKKVASLLGHRLSGTQIHTLLEALEFQVQPERQGFWVVAPSHRRDIEGPADVAEEIARIAGYDVIPEQMPSGRLPEPSPQPQQALARVARQALVACGLHEVITYSLVDPRLADRLNSEAGWPPATPSDSWLRVTNPMSVEQSALRPTLIGSLIETVKANLRHRRPILIFELARTYCPPLTPQPVEQMTLGLAMAGPAAPPAWNSPAVAVDFFSLKGVVERLFSALGRQPTFRRHSHPSFHPGQTGQVLVRDEAWSEIEVGVLGLLHPDVRDRFDLRTDLYLAEIDFERLCRLGSPSQAVVAPPRYPGVEVDLAVVVDERLDQAEVRRVIEASGGGLLSHVYLFDVYFGEPLPSGKKSLAYSLTFRSADRTLTEVEASQAQREIEHSLTQELGASIRGR